MPDLTGGGEGSPPGKIALRSHLITARRHLPPGDRLAANRQLQDQILACVRREHPPVIAAYVPIGTEPGGPDLVAALAAHARVLLPVLLPDGDLDWTFYDGPPSLAPGPRGLREPTGPRLGVDAITRASLVLVPALAVDRHGMRLGKGGGSYDRALARLTVPHSPGGRTPTDPTSPARTPGRRLVVALLYDGELVDEVPAEPHDRPVDAVITPSGGFTLSRAAEWTK